MCRHCLDLSAEVGLGPGVRLGEVWLGAALWAALPSAFRPNEGAFMKVGLQYSRRAQGAFEKGPCAAFGHVNSTSSKAAG